MKFGRSDGEWSELIDAANDCLIEVAKDRTIINYSDLSAELVRRTGYTGFDFGTERDQTAVGALLGAVTHGTYGEVEAMLSSLVVQKGTRGPEEGFYRYAKKSGLLRPGVEKFEFFQAQVVLVHRKYAG